MISVVKHSAFYWLVLSRSTVCLHGSSLSKTPHVLQVTELYLKHLQEDLQNSVQEGFTQDF